VPLTALGWSTASLTEARAMAVERLSRLMARVRAGEPLPRGYGYGSRPLREEVLKEIPEGDNSRLVITRNSYGATILNAGHALFLDIDLPAATLSGALQRLFGRKDDRIAAPLAELRATLERDGHATFRIYQTAAGLRALAVDREFEPAGSETQRLMEAARVDPAFRQLCRVQQSFRARLTPKPWRCGYRKPPTLYPRETPEAERRFAHWLEGYERACADRATCRFLETVGGGSPTPELDSIVRLHDGLTRSDTGLPLA
jgi:hypothetical protein